MAGLALMPMSLAGSTASFANNKQIPPNKPQILLSSKIRGQVNKNKFRIKLSLFTSCLQNVFLLALFIILLALIISLGRRYKIK